MRGARPARADIDAEAAPAVPALRRLRKGKRLLLGRPLRSDELEGRRLPKWLALPIFSSDPLSSVAYATEAALVVIVSVSLADRGVVFPISVAIAALLAVVALSYTRIVRVYSTSGGAYVVSRENLGTVPSLVAGAALLVDYVLTVAVSVAAGTLALTSAASSLHGVRVELALLFVAVIAVANLRGVREAGMLFALPTYGFIVALLATIAVGLGRCAVGGCPVASVPDPVAVGTGTVGVAVLLRAFASGSSALTGVESISNGVSAFRRPSGRNAALTIAVMAVVAIVLFLGVSYLAVHTHALPSEKVSVLSEIARAAFPAGSPSGFAFYLVQAFTFAILVFAANTSFQGFPRLAAVLAHDDFLPRRFQNLGDRLVFSNGVLVLTGVAAVLLLVFRANVDSLIHLYVLGVFVAFTLAQAGMVRHWLRAHERGWRGGVALNAVGAVATGLVTVIVLEAKFREGAWIVVVAIPLLVALFLAVRRQYRRVSRLTALGAAPLAPLAAGPVVVWAEGRDSPTAEALWYARKISRSHVDVTVAGGGEADALLAADDATVVPLPAGRRPLDGFVEYVERLPRSPDSLVTAVVPELYRRRSLGELVLGQASLRLKLRVLREHEVVTTDVSGLAGEPAAALAPSRLVGVVLVTQVDRPALRALAYARSLRLDEVRALSVALDRAETDALRARWERHAGAVPLDIVDAPLRDIGAPVLSYARGITSAPGTVAVVFMPELIVTGAPRLFHNQRELYLRRLLLFEPRVILASVPYRLA